MNGHRVRILIEVDSDEPRELDVIDDPRGALTSCTACLRVCADRLEFYSIVRDQIEGTT